MATITFKRGEEYIARISKLAAAKHDEVLGSAIYGAADIVTNEIRKQLEALPTDEGWGTSGQPVRGLKKAQKEALEESLGIASLQDDGGFLNVKIGFDGYNRIKSKRWPNGQPNQMVARSIERGTTWMQGHAFVKKAVAASRKAALTAMQDTIDKNIENIME